MNTIMAGGIFKTFGVIFITVEAKYDASAAFLSWTPSIAVALAFLMGESYDLYFGFTRYLKYLADVCNYNYHFKLILLLVRNKTVARYLSSFRPLLYLFVLNVFQSVHVCTFLRKQRKLNQTSC